MTKTTVIFRKWGDRQIIALFPEHPHDFAGRFCVCYAHIGQHGGADYYGMINRTTPATLTEYADLKAELESIGYVLEVKQKASWEMHQKRMSLARALARATLHKDRKSK